MVLENWGNITAGEDIGKNIKISAKDSLLYELKQHKPGFDKDRLKLSDQKKQAKFQWLQQPSQINIIISTM